VEAEEHLEEAVESLVAAATSKGLEDSKMAVLQGILTWLQHRKRRRNPLSVSMQKVNTLKLVN